MPQTQHTATTDNHFTVITIPALVAHTHARTHARTHKHTHGSLDFVQDYPGEPAPEPIWILLKQVAVA